MNVLHFSSYAAHNMLPSEEILCLLRVNLYLVDCELTASRKFGEVMKYGSSTVGAVVLPQ